MSQRLLHLAQRVEAGEKLCPTTLLIVEKTPLAEGTRLLYRQRWIRQLIERRRETDSAALIELLETAYALVAGRRGYVVGEELERNQTTGAELAERLRDLQPEKIRVSRYRHRRTAPDAELLAVEFYVRALMWPRMIGYEDYLVAMYCICRCSDYRFRLTPDAVPRLRALAADWAAVFDQDPSAATVAPRIT